MGYTVKKAKLSGFCELGLIILYVLLFSRYCRCNEALCATGQNAQLMRSCNSRSPELNFTTRQCEVSLDTLVIPVVLVFPEFLLISAQYPTKDDRD